MFLVCAACDSFMGIVYPSKAVARRWDGALQARLRRAPLESFLQARGIAPAPRGLAQDNDDLVRATVLIVEAGLALYFAPREERLAFRQRLVVGHVACLVSRALVEQISQPDAWPDRCTRQHCAIALALDRPQCCSDGFGNRRATISRRRSLREFRLWIGRIMQSARDALNANGPDAMLKSSTNIAARLNAEAPAEHCALRVLRGSNRGFQSGV